jgi:DNA-binding IclR family transcriptional regulator
MTIISHNIAQTRRSKALPPTARMRRPSDRRSLSRSATRALDVLEYFGATQRPLRAIEISNALSLHPSTTDQLLKTMVDSAHLVFDAHTKRYYPSPRLAGFGAWLAQGYYGGDRVRSLLKALNAATGENITLSSPNDVFMQVVDAVWRPDCLDQAERGLRVPMFGSAIGGAYLATLPESAVQELMTRARVPASEAPEMLEGVRRIQRDGYAFGGMSADDSIWSVSIALPQPALGVPLVLGLAGPARRVEANRLTYFARMREAIAYWTRPVEDPATTPGFSG